MKVGASYYPELSEPETWRADLLTARSLGLEVLRCGEFAWSRLSPVPDSWNAAWAREFLDVAGEFGFEVIWCTPSATPPPYLFDAWPDLTARDQHQTRMPVGVRRNYCPSHAGYRQLCGTTAARLVQDLGAHPVVKGWQIDNEIAGDGFTCWCERCGVAFQHWLEQRYGNLDGLNRAWQTDVWSQRYTRWEQIPIPQIAFPAHAPALKLAWRRFRSDNWLDFYRAQKNPMKAAGARQPITTNFFNLNWHVPFDQWAWRPELDVIGVSQYLEDEVAVRFEYALLQGLDTKALWVLEQKAGQQNAQNLYPEDLHRLGRRLELNHETGIEYSVYWHLRQHRAGCEMEHGAVLRHDGRATRIGASIKRGIENSRSAPVAPRSDIHALVFDFHQHWAQDNRPQPGTAWSYRETLEQDWHGAASDLGHTCAVGPLESACARAKIVLAPHFQMVRDEHLAVIHDFLHRGGVFVTTVDFGRLDWENNVRPQPPLGAWAPWCTLPAGEMFHLKSNVVIRGEFQDVPLCGRYFWFVPSEASVIHLSDQELAGPAVLEFVVGAGKLRLLTSALDRSSLAGVLDHFAP